jgi:beta-lactamase regulating signal transducer with metallopeptidase domain
MPPLMIHVSSDFLIALANAAVRSLVLGCMVAAAIGTFQVKNARIKLLLWKGVLLAALAMPLLTVLAPAIQVAVPMPSFQGRRAKAEGTITRPSLPHEAAPQMPAKRVPRASKHVQLETAGSPAGPSQPVASVSSAPRREIPWPLLAVCAYLAIGLAFMARVFVGMRFGKHLIRAAIPVDDDHALRILSTTSTAAGLRAAPRIAEADIISVPVVIGVSDPAILLPSNWREWDDDELAAVVAHEVSHVERHDALTQRLALIHRAIFWFSPLSWWLERHLAALAEQASDDAALAGGADRTRYAETLLGFFAELEAGPERVWWQGVSMAKAGQAEKRVERILAWRGAMSNRLKKSLVVVLVAVVAPVVVLTAAVHPATYDIQTPAAPAAPPTPAAPPQADPTPSAAANPPQPPATASDSASAKAPELPSYQASPEVPEQEIHIVTRVMPAIPAIHIPAINMPAIPAISVPPIPPVAFSMSGNWNSFRGFQGGYFVGRYNDWGPRFVIVTKDSDAMTMSGDRDDAEHARSLRSKIPGEFIWFERDHKSYVISDQATVDRAKAFWAPQEKLSKEQEELGKQQEALGQQQEEAARKMEEVKLKIPDLTAEMQKLESEMKQLSANGGTMEQLGDLQGELGELQSRIGEVQSGAGRERGAWGREQGEWGRKMGELGRRQGELGRQQAALAREASHQMQQLLDDAVSKGLAKPE